MTVLVFVALFVVIRAVGGEGATWQATGWMKVIEVPAEWFMQFVDGAARLVKGAVTGPR